LWEKNREKKVFARQKAGKIGSFWGNAFRSKVGTLELRSTCVQSNRLPFPYRKLCTESDDV
ncbi:MAG TPA: hypothetical protein VJY33_22925, partial [Isosphaeraceae bacterium]|nr:hypothetical protein [Isosphaeraceae bacterium]